jgi:glycosyltransferase involved in cell wall biosynthesis
MEIAVIVPTLGRPDALGPLVENLRRTTPPAYRLCFVVDPDDEASHSALAALSPAPEVLVLEHGGTYPVKVNAGARATAEPLLLPTADDVVFHPGWYEAALSRFRKGAQVVGTSDLTPATEGGRHATMPIVTRSYVEDPGAAYGEKGVVFHEGYHHNFVETELWQLACHRGVAVFEPASVIEHRHPSWGTAEVDDTYRRGSLAGWGPDRALFEGRMAQWKS